MRVGYFGTIADWLDFDILLGALRRYRMLQFHLFGPVVAGKIPGHERLILHPPVQHDELPALGQWLDGFVMPFQLKQLTEAVDPVKLYEYLALRRETFCIRYKEIERFNNYVHLYEDSKHFCSLMNEFTHNTLVRKNDQGQSEKFLIENTWLSRCNEVCKRLADLD